MQEGNGWLGLFWNNHDNPRSTSRFGNTDSYLYESATMLAQALHMLRGTPYIYQGEEFAMTNPKFNDLAEYDDVETINAYKEMMDYGVEEKAIMRMLNNKSRDNSRTPIQWDGSKPYAGFSDNKPWLKLADNYEKINAAKDRESNKSVFNYYKKLIKLRKENDLISDGKFVGLYQDHDYLLAYKRVLDDRQLININNFSEKSFDIKLEDLVDDISDYDILISNYGLDKLDGILSLRPYESVAIISK